MSTRIGKQKPMMRKEPRQARSRATVETIIQAGARVLSREGWAGFTTNKVADLAGVSVGSLYQYFPDKLSLVDAIRQNHLDDCLSIMRKIKAKGLAPMEFVANIVQAMIEAHSTYPGLHRVLLDEAPSSDDYRNPNSGFEIEYLAYYADAVSIYRNRQPNKADHIKALIISDAVDGVIHNAARRGLLDDPTIQSELIRLVSKYLDEGINPE
ncbi:MULTISPECIES: TetR/AcrR family transcriptional regulator [Pseudomonas]|uniref:TetR/AcrR family transcriptional regulator n=1 Tax=Pseudomonas TaxID=286 RepID=UPI00248128EA|nr:TetR/AcrR family transcriptional regulator [Pseudomonas marginalis]WGT28069.1 TetR/AcrR family transcriptional regulator [Pseudomonas marginalis]